MRAPRLVQMLREKSDAMSGDLVTKIRASAKGVDLLTIVPESEQKQCTRAIYEDLTGWLGSKSDAVLEQRYVALGKRRASQGVPASQLFWAVSIAQEYLWDYMQQECLLEDPVEFWGGVLLLRSLTGFFARVVYFTLIGYEQAARNESTALDYIGRRRSA